MDPVHLGGCWMNRFKASTRILATACLLGASAYAQTSTQQCTFQSSYPNPVDADGNAVGALLKVSFKSQIGLVLDEIPLEMRGRVADWLRAQPSCAAAAPAPGRRSSARCPRAPSRRCFASVSPLAIWAVGLAAATTRRWRT